MGIVMLVGGCETISSQWFAFTRDDVRSVVERQRHRLSLVRSELVEAKKGWLQSPSCLIEPEGTARSALIRQIRFNALLA